MIRAVFALFFFITAPILAQELPERVNAVHQNVWLAGQPSSDQIDAWQAAGATAIINIRPEDEMATLGFAEPSHVVDLGMSYSSMSVGGSAGFSPAMTAALTGILESLEGEQVVLHCVSGTRAAHIYTAHLIETGQLAPEEADALALTPRGSLNAVVMRQLSPRYAEAFPE